jgi:polyphosphate glucokinase
MTNSAGHPPQTLAIDIGGTGLKASVLDYSGRMVETHVRIPTPYPCSPAILVEALVELTAPLTSYDRISIGFPGVVRDGRIITAPHFKGKTWKDYPLAETLARRFGKPARVLNDAEVQGLGIIKGQGLEVVLTLGTGVGSAIFSNGALTPHLELAQHPVHRDETYNEYVGNAARQALSGRKWNKRVLKVIEHVYSLVHYDILYLGGGNAARVTVALPDNIHIASNDAGITGGIRLWDEAVWSGVIGRRAEPAEH